MGNLRESYNSSSSSASFFRRVLILSIFIVTISNVICQNGGPEKPKPSKCEGNLTVSALIPEIKSITSTDFTQELGNVSYSLAMNGTLGLLSQTVTFKSSQILNQVESNNSMRTLQSVYGSGQIKVVSDPVELDSSWVSKWTSMSFSGILYISVIVHDGVCASSPTVIDKVSSCNYNSKSDLGFVGSGKCKWAIVDKVHHLGDPDPNEGGGGGDQ